MDTKPIKNLVLSGGGIKGALTIGSIKELEKNGLLNNVENVLGTSIGSFLGLLMIIGYSGEDMSKIVCDINMNEYRKVSIRNLMTDFGLDNGEDIIKFWKAIIKVKTGNSNITFKELYKKYDKSLIVSVVQLNPTKTVYINKENEPDMAVIDAIRMSISVPIYFTPHKLNGKFVLDGSTIDHFHGGYFNDEERTLYLLIYTKNMANMKEDDIKTFEVYLKFMVYSLFDYVQKGQFEEIAFNPKVMNIEYKYSEVEFMDSNVGSTEMKSMISEGSNETKKYLERIEKVNKMFILKKKVVLKNIFDEWKKLERG